MALVLFIAGHIIAGLVACLVTAALALDRRRFLQALGFAVVSSAIIAFGGWLMSTPPFNDGLLQFLAFLVLFLGMLVATPVVVYGVLFVIYSPVMLLKGLIGIGSD